MLLLFQLILEDLPFRVVTYASNKGTEAILMQGDCVIEDEQVLSQSGTKELRYWGVSALGVDPGA